MAATCDDDRIDLADDLVEQAAFAARDGRWPAALAAADEAVRILRDRLDTGAGDCLWRLAEALELLAYLQLEADVYPWRTLETVRDLVPARRQELHESPQDPPDGLVRALRLEARVLDAVDHADEAAAVRRRADALARAAAYVRAQPVPPPGAVQRRAGRTRRWSALLIFAAGATTVVSTVVIQYLIPGRTAVDVLGVGVLMSLAGPLLALPGQRTDLTRRHEARTADTAEEVGRLVGRGDPDRYEPVLAHELHLLGLRLSWAGRHREASETTAEAVRLHRHLVAEGGDPGKLAEALYGFAAVRVAAGVELWEAVGAARESVDLHRGQGSVPGAELGRRTLADAYAAFGRAGEAAEVLAGLGPEPASEDSSTPVDDVIDLAT